MAGARLAAHAFAAPPTSFNRILSANRVFAFSTLPLEDALAAKRGCGATLNDVVLAMVSGALRRYLLERGELPAPTGRRNKRDGYDEEAGDRGPMTPELTDPLGAIGERDRGRGIQAARGAVSRLARRSARLRCRAGPLGANDTSSR